MSENRCVNYNAIIPEGRMICPNCEKPKSYAFVISVPFGRRSKLRNVQKILNARIVLPPKMQELKILPDYFLPVKYGLKTFEVRSVKDRSFKVGELLLLREYNATCGEYTGDSVTVQVAYILGGGNYGIVQGYAVLGIKLMGGGGNESK